jgi:hypothetical protein
VEDKIGLDLERLIMLYIIHSTLSDLYEKILIEMLSISLIILLFLGSSLISCKKQEPVCVEPLDGVAAYPCESRPSKEPLSLQYSKAQS